MNVPAWAQGDESKRLRFVFNSCAAYHNEHASMAKFSAALGFSPITLRKAVEVGRVSTKLARAIEQLLGRDVVTFEQLCPHAQTK